MNETVEKVKAAVDAPKVNFDPKAFDYQTDKIQERELIRVARIKFLAGGEREGLHYDRKTGKVTPTKVTGSIAVITGDGNNRKVTRMKFFRPGLGAQMNWKPGCVPLPVKAK